MHVYVVPDIVEFVVAFTAIFADEDLVRALRFSVHYLSLAVAEVFSV